MELQEYKDKLYDAIIDYNNLYEGIGKKLLPENKDFDRNKDLTKEVKLLNQHTFSKIIEIYDGLFQDCSITTGPLEEYLESIFNKFNITKVNEKTTGDMIIRFMHFLVSYEQIRANFRGYKVNTDGSINPIIYSPSLKEVLLCNCTIETLSLINMGIREILDPSIEDKTEAQTLIIESLFPIIKFSYFIGLETEKMFKHAQGLKVLQ